MKRRIDDAGYAKDGSLRHDRADASTRLNPVFAASRRLVLRLWKASLELGLYGFPRGQRDLDGALERGW
jgi:hypothetical protein